MAIPFCILESCAWTSMERVMNQRIHGICRTIPAFLELHCTFEMSSDAGVATTTSLPISEVGVAETDPRPSETCKSVGDFVPPDSGFRILLRGFGNMHGCFLLKLNQLCQKRAFVCWWCCCLGFILSEDHAISNAFPKV